MTFIITHYYTRPDTGTDVAVIKWTDKPRPPCRCRLRVDCTCHLPRRNSMANLKPIIPQPIIRRRHAQATKEKTTTPVDTTKDVDVDDDGLVHHSPSIVFSDDQDEDRSSQRCTLVSFFFLATMTITLLVASFGCGFTSALPWYPASFLRPLIDNQPEDDSLLSFPSRVGDSAPKTVVPACNTSCVSCLPFLPTPMAVDLVWEDVALRQDDESSSALVASSHDFVGDFMAPKTVVPSWCNTALVPSSSSCLPFLPMPLAVIDSVVWEDVASLRQDDKASSALVLSSDYYYFYSPTPRFSFSTPPDMEMVHFHDDSVESDDDSIHELEYTAVCLSIGKRDNNNNNNNDPPPFFAAAPVSSIVPFDLAPVDIDSHALVVYELPILEKGATPFGDYTAVYFDVWTDYILTPSLPLNEYALVPYAQHQPLKFDILAMELLAWCAVLLWYLMSACWHWIALPIATALFGSAAGETRRRGLWRRIVLFLAGRFIGLRHLIHTKKKQNKRRHPRFDFLNDNPLLPPPPRFDGFGFDGGVDENRQPQLPPLNDGHVDNDDNGVFLPGDDDPTDNENPVVDDAGNDDDNDGIAGNDDDDDGSAGNEEEEDEALPPPPPPTPPRQRQPVRRSNRLRAAAAANNRNNNGNAREQLGTVQLGTVQLGTVRRSARIAARPPVSYRRMC